MIKIQNIKLNVKSPFKIFNGLVNNYIYRDNDLKG